MNFQYLHEKDSRDRNVELPKPSYKYKWGCRNCDYTETMTVDEPMNSHVCPKCGSQCSMIEAGGVVCGKMQEEEDTVTGDRKAKVTSTFTPLFSDNKRK